MSAEVDWVLDRIGTLDVEVPLQRVNRDESKMLDMTGQPRQRKGDLQTANFVGAHLTDRATEPIGTEYDHAVETVVGVRIEGLTHHEYGHVDPAGDSGIPWADLVRTIKQAILAERTFPQVDSDDGTYKDCFIENEAPQSSDFKDYYRYDFDVRFSGFKSLP